MFTLKNLNFLQYHPPYESQQATRTNWKYFFYILSTRLKVKQSSFFTVIILITLLAARQLWVKLWLTSSIFHYSIVLKRREKSHSADGIKFEKKWWIALLFLKCSPPLRWELIDETKQPAKRALLLLRKKLTHVLHSILCVVQDEISWNKSFWKLTGRWWCQF